MNKFRVFVYGTLKSGFSNSSLLSEAKLIEKGIVVKGVKLINYPYFPYAIKGTNDDESVGEIYEIDDHIH